MGAFWNDFVADWGIWIRGQHHNSQKSLNVFLLFIKLFFSQDLRLTLNIVALSVRHF